MCSRRGGGGVDGYCRAALPTWVCRAAAGSCDLPERCDGLRPACPPDAPQPDGTECPDALMCNGIERCVAGTCGAGTAASCDDGDACTDDRCAEPGGCAHSAIADCCRGDSECDDRDACTEDHCTGHRCAHALVMACADAGTPDVSSRPDAAPDDVRPDAAPDDVRPDATPADAALDMGGPDAASPGSSAAAGCACASAPREPSRTPGVLLAALVAAGLVRGRRRRGARPGPR